MQTVQLAKLRGCERQLADAFSTGGRRLLRMVPSPYLPPDLRRQIQLDVEAMGPTIAKLLPAAEAAILKLEVFGESCCSRWHQDKFTCRAIITYNGRGTEYVQHSNVDFSQLASGGGNDNILIDGTQVFSAKAADILFMKGTNYPCPVNGLVHKSPEKRYHANGAVMSRLCLKIDVP